MRLNERATRIIVAALSRFMDELPTLTLALIAVLLILLDGKANLTHDAVLAIVSGFLGYMKSKGNQAPPPAPPAP